MRRLCKLTAAVLLFTSCWLSAAAILFKMKGFSVEFDDATTEKFLNIFCDDPGDFRLVLDSNGSFVDFNSSGIGIASGDVYDNTSQTFRCTLQVDELRELYTVQCNSTVVTPDTFGNVTNCTVQQLNSSCLHQCAYIWTSSVKYAPFLVDVGQCQRTEDRFYDMCPDTEMAQQVEDYDDGHGPDPMKVISYCIIFLQTSIIVVFMGFMIYIDIW